MNDKQINKWLRRRFSAVGWVLVIYYVLLNLFVFLTMELDMAKQTIWSIAAGDFSGSIDYDALMGNAWGYVAAVLVGFVLLHAWKGPDYWRQEILRKERKISPMVLFACFSFCMGAQMINSLWIMVVEWVMNLFGRSAQEVLEQVSGTSDTFSMFLYASILAPVAEEVLFRGYVLRSLHPFGRRFAILGSAVVFGLFHGNLLQTPYAFLMGLVLGYLTVEYSIVWAILLHMFNNLVLADLLTRFTAGWSDMAFGFLNLFLFGGFLIVSVVLLITKRHEIRDYQRGEWMDRRCVKWFFLSSGILALTILSIYNMVMMLLW